MKKKDGIYIFGVQGNIGIGAGMRGSLQVQNGSQNVELLEGSLDARLFPPCQIAGIYIGERKLQENREYVTDGMWFGLVKVSLKAGEIFKVEVRNYGAERVLYPLLGYVKYKKESSDAED